MVPMLATPPVQAATPPPPAIIQVIARDARRGWPMRVRPRHVIAVSQVVVAISARRYAGVRSAWCGTDAPVVRSFGCVVTRRAGRPLGVTVRVFEDGSYRLGRWQLLDPTA